MNYILQYCQNSSTFDLDTIRFLNPSDINLLIFFKNANKYLNVDLQFKIGDFMNLDSKNDDAIDILNDKIFTFLLLLISTNLSVDSNLLYSEAENVVETAPSTIEECSFNPIHVIHTHYFVFQNNTVKVASTEEVNLPLNFNETTPFNLNETFGFDIMLVPKNKNSKVDDNKADNCIAAVNLRTKPDTSKVGLVPISPQVSDTSTIKFDATNPIFRKKDDGVKEGRSATQDSITIALNNARSNIEESLNFEEDY